MSESVLIAASVCCPANSLTRPTVFGLPLGLPTPPGWNCPLCFWPFLSPAIYYKSRNLLVLTNLLISITHSDYPSGHAVLFSALPEPECRTRYEVQPFTRDRPVRFNECMRVR